jgi:predicted anti-sigma-YlaC factor YlaD
MVELAALACFYLAFGLVYGADRGRFPLKRWKPARLLFAGMKLVAALSTSVGVALWARVEGATAALLVAVTALSVAAIVFILVAPIAPRAVWGLAFSVPLLVLGLLLAGGARG